MRLPVRHRPQPLSRGRAYDTVSFRLMAIILLSVLPVAILGGLMAWHSYVATLDASSARAAVVAHTLKAQIDQRLSDTNGMLHRLAQQPELRQPESCNGLLRLAMTLRTAPLRDLVLLGPDHQPLCSAPQTVRSRTGTQAEGLTLLADDGSGRPLLRLNLRAIGPLGDAILSADLPLEWDGPSGGATRAWLVGADGQKVPLCGRCSWSRPDAETPVPARGLLPGRISDVGRIGAAPGRALQLSAVAGLDLLVVTEPSVKENRALSLFVWRVVAIVLVLLAGLVAVLLGASWLIVEPLRQMTISVGAWRDAGSYRPITSKVTPVELLLLSRAFADATRTLAAHEERLRKAETKQELLIKEIHHRVKNNLQIIASLLNLQANRIRQPEARAEFASARDRVRALATLHRHLYAEGELHTLNMKSFLEELCGQIFQAIGEKEGRRIRLEIEAPDIVMSTDQAVPLALIVTEAVSNAIKYAFPGGRSGLVSVHLAETAAGIVTLVIRDDGIGIPAGRAETETGIRDGLGIQLIRGFARQLGATLEVIEGDPEPQDGHPGTATGTCYTLLVPLHPTSDADHDDSAKGEAV